MNRGPLLLGALLLAALGLLAAYMDRTLAAQGQRRRADAAAEAVESARRAGLAVRAALADVEQAAVEGRASTGVAWQVVAPPRRSVPGPSASGLGDQPRTELVRLLSSDAVSPSGLPLAAVAAVALGDAASLDAAAERLESGDLPIAADDVALLASRLGARPEAAAELERRLRSLPDPARIPEVPAFERRAEGGVVTGWARRGSRIVHSEVPVDQLLRAAGIAGDVQQQRRPGDVDVRVPDVDSLVLGLVPTRAVSTTLLRVLLWGLVAACTMACGGLVLALERERRVIAREKEFLATITHELRTPIAAIKLFGETLAQGRGEPVEYGALVASEASRLESLTERVLTAARLEAAPRLARCAPRAILEEALAPVRARAERAGKVVDSDATVLPDATWDAVAVRQAVMNLLDNALRHGATRVALSAREEAGAIAVTVADDGPGVARRDRARIFGRFERGAAATAGTGLGLWLVDQVARAHGGSVDVRSVPGQGAQFTLRLPIGPAEDGRA